MKFMLRKVVSEIMRLGRLELLILVLLTLPMTNSPAWASGRDKHVKITEYGEGDAYCPPRALTIGGMIVPAGRCYKLVVLRDRRGAFLAFMDPSVRVHSGKIERLDSDEGRRARGHIFFLVPMRMTGQIALLPVNTIQAIRLREEDDEDDNQGDSQDDNHVRHAGGSKLIILLPNAPTPNVGVTIVVSF